MNKILIVEDERAISQLIKINLDDAGYLCHCSYNGIDAFEMINKESYDLILLDIMLPGISGYELMEYIRSYEIPTIFLTAKSETEEKVKGLKLGADDYMSKPFEIIELLARVEAVLRRNHKLSKHIHLFDIEIDLESRLVKKDKDIINLTAKEFDILLLFVRNKNIALYRERIYEIIWKDIYIGDSRTVDLHVQRMRKKLGLEDKIVPVYKIGYRLEV